MEHHSSDSKETALEKMSVAARLLNTYGIGLDEIAEATRLPRGMVQEALDPRRIESCPLIVLAKVLVATERHLVKRGWQGERKELWREIHILLAQRDAERAMQYASRLDD